MSADVIAWLRSPEGEQWSRERHDVQPAEVVVTSGRWTPVKGRRNLAQDPCGRGPVKNAATRGK